MSQHSLLTNATFIKTPNIRRVIADLLIGLNRLKSDDIDPNNTQWLDSLSLSTNGLSTYRLSSD